MREGGWDGGGGGSAVAVRHPVLCVECGDAGVWPGSQPSEGARMFWAARLAGRNTRHAICGGRRAPDRLNGSGRDLRETL